MKLAYTIGILAWCGMSCGHTVGSKPRIEPGRYVKTITEGDLKRSYVLRVPKKYDNKTNLPLVFVFHGWTSSADEAEVYTQFGAKSEKEGFILVIPNGTEGVGSLKGWNTGFLNLGNQKADDVKLTSDILDEVEKAMYVDEDRVYVAGHSNGAMLAYRIGAQLSDRIAAIGVVSGTIGISDSRITDPVGPVSAIIFHGKADDTVPYDEHTQGLIQSIPAPECAKWWAQKDGCGPMTETKSDDIVIDDYKPGPKGAEVEFVSIDKGGHGWPGSSRKGAKPPATDMIWEFFRTHPRHR